MIQLRARTTIDLAEPDVDLGLVTWFDVDIVDRDDDERERTIGNARVAMILVGEAANVGVPLYDVLDADSGDLEALYEIYFEDEWLKDGFADGSGSNVLYIDDLTIDDGWRGHGIELAVVRRLCDSLGEGCALAVMPVEDELRAQAWRRMGFEVTVPPNGETVGYLHLRLGLRNPRVIEEGGRFRAIPNPRPGDEDERH